MENEIIERKDNCLWFSKNVCKIPKDKMCPDDCDLKTLEFDKDKIIQRMKDEEKHIKELKKKGMFKNREKIKDIVMGLYTLQKVLKKHFNHTEAKVVDSDFEKTANVVRNWRK